MKFRRTLGITAATVALGVIGAPQAFAADEWMYTEDSSPGGKVDFTAKGDIFKLCDQDPFDGNGVMLRVYDKTINKYKIHEEKKNASGCSTYRASMGGDYNLREGSLLQVDICLLVNGTVNKYCDQALWMNEN